MLYHVVRNMHHCMLSLGLTVRCKLHVFAHDRAQSLPCRRHAGPIPVKQRSLRYESTRKIHCDNIVTKTVQTSTSIFKDREDIPLAIAARNVYIDALWLTVFISYSEISLGVVARQETTRCWHAYYFEVVVWRSLNTRRVFIIIVG